MNVKQKIGLGIVAPLFVLSLGQMAIRDNVIKKEKAGIAVSDTEKAIAHFGITEIDTADINNFAKKIENTTKKIQKANEEYEKQAGEQNIIYHKINYDIKEAKELSENSVECGD
jgi:hypothetical protein